LDIATQSDLFTSLQKWPALYSLSLSRPPETNLRIRKLYSNFIVAVGHVSLDSLDVSSFYSHLFKATTIDETLVFLAILTELGPVIASVPNLSFEPFTPLQQFFNLSSGTIIVPIVLAVMELMGTRMHWYLNVASSQIVMNVERTKVFQQLLQIVAENVNFFRSFVACRCP
jgi:hypothetical protein